MPRQGWLQRQFDLALTEIQQWPEWMRRGVHPGEQEEIRMESGGQQSSEPSQEVYQGSGVTPYDIRQTIERPACCLDKENNFTKTIEST